MAKRIGDELELMVRCPECGAEVGEQCHTSGDHARKTTHNARLRRLVARLSAFLKEEER